MTACERWTLARGYDKLYLKVEKKNAAAVSFYTSLGYQKTKLPWGDGNCNDVGDNRWDTTLLLEKSLKLRGEGVTRSKRTWIRDQFWRPNTERFNPNSAESNTTPPI